MEASSPPPPGLLARAVGALGAQLIYFLIWLFGERHRRAELPWLDGPLGGEVIGDAPYREAAAAEGLTLERQPAEGGLLPSFVGALDGEGFDAAAVHPLVREFYERTTAFSIDAWSRAHFPASLALALLVTTISRQVDQLNFPLSPLDAARGVSSEILLLRRGDGTVRYAGWLRKLTAENRVLYTGFYLAERIPGEPGPCVKVVFPMPRGNATVLLRPALGEGGALLLDTHAPRRRARRFGGAGFYRLQQRDEQSLRVWRIRTLREHFRVFVDPADPEGVVRCDHAVRFLGLPVISMHYKLTRQRARPGDGGGATAGE
jgi:hypothetical protein